MRPKVLTDITSGGGDLAIVRDGFDDAKAVGCLGQMPWSLIRKCLRPLLHDLDIRIVVEIYEAVTTDCDGLGNREFPVHREHAGHPAPPGSPGSPPPAHALRQFLKPQAARTHAEFYSLASCDTRYEIARPLRACVDPPIVVSAITSRSSGHWAIGWDRPPHRHPSTRCWSCGRSNHAVSSMKVGKLIPLNGWYWPRTWQK